METEEEIPLTGGHMTGGVVRVGETVRRPMSPVSPAVHQLLRHLERAGFDGAPKVLGVDARGREILSFHAGPLLVESFDQLASEEGYARYAALVAAFHRAAASFDPAQAAVWSELGRDPGGGAQILHGDLGPWNVVAGEDQWVIIDWDSAAPGRIEWELAYVLHVSVPFFPGFGLTDEQVVRRTRLFAEAYGMSPSLVQETLALVPQRCRATLELFRAGAAGGDPSFVRMVEQGHDRLWAASVDHVDDAITRWQAMLTPPASPASHG